MLTPSRYWVSKNTFLPERALKSMVATARSTASETTSCSVARRDLLMPQPAESRTIARAMYRAGRTGIAGLARGISPAKFSDGLDGDQRWIWQLAKVLNFLGFWRTPYDASRACEWS